AAPVPGGAVRPGADSDIAPAPDRVPVFLLQPAHGPPESGARGREPGRGAGAPESRTVPAAQRRGRPARAGRLPRLPAAPQPIVYEAGSPGRLGFRRAQLRIFA